ncbi:hypothetical protein [Pseudoalteromonas sp. JC3]|uniref:hypothetical protein n=1 Tax=Pseudoalteromonas sp. JC3 TaxID=2810196 RepID=UPI0019D172DA|nr:hypothetical protein [Pseudoalteromonas sp. JC3]MBR8844535.1 hypothetical protein [Pseudoalteromonas sp. JC3]WJE10367.1 hypothetical protein QSH61_07910 [Pseudoalteromonas sp. JC3]
MSIFAQTEVISIAVAVAVMTLAQVVVFYIYKQNKERKYDEEKRRVEMEKLRESFEKRIYDLTERLISREDRWRDVNHLVFDSKANNRNFPAKTERAKYSSFLSASGLNDSDYEVEGDLVFVITPFNEKYDSDYEQISKVCNEVGLRCIRGDEQFIKGDILSHILKHIVKARLVIANINGRNPNVFYELGIAHALDKPTLITSKTVEDIPFDLRTQQLVIYNEKEQLAEQLSKALLKVTLKNA